MSKFIFLIKNSAWFFGSSVVGRVLSFALLPLYTAYLSPTDYGIIAICLMISDFIGNFSTLGLQKFTGRVLLRFYDKKERLALILGNLYVVSIILILVTSITISFFPGLIIRFFFEGSEIPSVMIVFIPIWLAFFVKISSYLQGYQQIMQLGRSFFVITTVRTGLLHTFKIIVLVIFKFGVIGFLAAELITEGLIAITSVVLLFRMVRPKINFKKKRIIEDGFRYGIPFVPQALSSWVLKYIDRIILLKLLNMWSVGLYSFAMNFASAVFNFVFYPIRSGIAPEIGRRMDHSREYENADETLIEYLYSVVLICSGVGLMVSLFAEEAIRILANYRYHSAFIVVPFAVLHLILQNARETFSVPIDLKYKTGFHPLNTFLGGVLNIGGNFLLIPVYGIVGAALATVVTSFVMMLVTLLYAQRLIYVNYNFLIAGLPVLAALGLYVGGWSIRHFSEFAFMVKLLIVPISMVLSFVYLRKNCPIIWDRALSVIRSERIVRVKDPFAESEEEYLV